MPVDSTAALEARVQRLSRSLTLLWALAVLAALWGLARREYQVRMEPLTRPRAGWDGATLRLGTGLDGRCLVTHLHAWGPGAGAVAVLEPPVVLWESGWTDFPAERWRALRWHDARGAAVAAPPPGEPLTLGYVPYRLWPPASTFRGPDAP